MTSVTDGANIPEADRIALPKSELLDHSWEFDVVFDLTGGVELSGDPTTTGYELLAAFKLKADVGTGELGFTAWLEASTPATVFRPKRRSRSAERPCPNRRIPGGQQFAVDGKRHRVPADVAVPHPLGRLERGRDEVGQVTLDYVSGEIREAEVEVSLEDQMGTGRRVRPCHRAPKKIGFVRDRHRG
ncbi:MAG: hypothetical protein ACOC2Q_01095 [Spirochaetota bacterium]